MDNLKPGHIKKLRRELADIEERIKNLKVSGKDLVTDTVNDYSNGFPKVIAISGYGDEKYKDAKNKLYNQYARKRIEILREIDKVEAAISEADPETRTILRMIYIDGISQEEIAKQMSYSRETIKRRLKHFHLKHKS